MKEKYGILVTGLAGNQDELTKVNPLKIRKKGIQIALLNMTYGTNRGADLHWPKTLYINQKESLKKAFERAGEADLTLALPHWGTEYILEHSESQESTALWLAENGADMIIGTHPHVIQDMQTLELGDRKVSVAYSLGNALSNMSAQNTQMGIIAWIRMARNHLGNVEVLPMEFTYIWCSRPGGYDTGYTIIPVSRFIGRRELWKGAWDYDKMMTTLERVTAATGIKDKDIL
jgi:poly-gamma-glutamate synthesis protein (capsule biosynthesis protein)